MTTKLETFKAFVAERDATTDWHRFIAPNEMKLVRTKICDQCQFPRSAIYQDEKIVRFLDSVEVRLRAEGILRNPHVPVQPTGETIDELEEAMERKMNELIMHMDELLARCAVVSEKLDLQSRHHSAYPARDK